MHSRASFDLRLLKESTNTRPGLAAVRMLVAILAELPVASRLYDTRGSSILPSQLALQLSSTARIVVALRHLLLHDISDEFCLIT